MVHRVILGSIERFIGVLIEHYAGNFPLWLAPVQAVVLTVTDNQIPLCSKGVQTTQECGDSCAEDLNEKLNFKIREAQLQKIPYMLVIGDKEVEQGTVTPRYRDGKNLHALKPDEFIAFVETETKAYK